MVGTGAPRFPATPRSFKASCLLALVRDRRLDRLGSDRNRAGLFLFRDLALQLDRQQAIGKLRARDLHMVGKLEAALKIASGDAAIEKPRLVLTLRRLAADQKLVFLLGDVQLGFGKACDRHHDPVGVFASLLYVVRRVAITSGLAGHGIE